MSDVVETTSDEDGGSARGIEGREEGARRKEGARGGRKEEPREREGYGGRARGVRAIILLFHRGRTPRWR